MSVKYAPSKLRVPPGFQYLLEGLAREVLREQPEDIIKFADNYFKLKLKERREGIPRKLSTEAAPASTDEPPAEDGNENEIVASPSQEEENAAIKIQSMMRGAKARKEVAELRNSTTNAVVEDTPAEPETVETVETVEEPATEEEPFEMPEAGTKDEEELLSAATKIQAVFRGHKTRKEVEEIKSSSHAIANTEEVANVEEVEDTPAEDSTAAETAPEDSATEGEQPAPTTESATTDETLSDIKTDAEETPTTETETDKGETEASETAGTKSESEPTSSEIKTEETTSDSTEEKTETENESAAPESGEATAGEKTDTEVAAGSEGENPAADPPAPAES